MKNELKQIGTIRSSLKELKQAPLQGDEGGVQAKIVIFPEFKDAMLGLSTGSKIIILTWLHQANHKIMQVHPRSDLSNPLTGVFATRSPHRPNPIGLHSVKVKSIHGRSIEVVPLEAIDGTPVIDIKPDL